MSPLARFNHIALGCAIAAVAGACGHAQPPQAGSATGATASLSSAVRGASPVAEPDPAWQNTLPPGAEVFARLRVAALLRDEHMRALVEPLAKAALARGDARIVLAPVIERADELVVASRADASTDEALLVLVGVRAEVGTDAIHDAHGERAFHEVGRTDRIVEEQTADGVLSLFVLPGRTWVISGGADRLRVRRALLTAKPAPEDDDVVPLAELRLRGSDLVRRIPRLGTGMLADVGTRLDAMHLVVRSFPAEQMIVRLVYPDVDARARAERVLTDVKDAAVRSKKLPWFEKTAVRGDGRNVTLTWELKNVPATAPSL